MAKIGPFLILGFVLTSGAPERGAEIIREWGPATKDVVAEKQFRMAHEAEAGLKVTARAPGTSWGTKGSEAAILTCKLDGEYNQEIILFRGEDKFTYRALLGRLAEGAHSLTLEINRGLSSAGVQSVEVSGVEISPLEMGRSSSVALAHAPILYARPNSIGRFTDIPLLMWYEQSEDAGGTVIRYSFVFANEDAGTATEALMARWGRATDIEWAYEVKLGGDEIAEETFQAISHQARPFRGKKLAGHPLLVVASDNNNFSDTGESGMRFGFWPEPMELKAHSREELMDRHPWTYKVMAQELAREGKIGESGGHIIRDPRAYVYIEAWAPREEMGINLVVGTRDGRRFDSDLGREDLRIRRGGWFRVAVRLPQFESPDQARTIAVDCHPGKRGSEPPPECEGVVVQKVFRLDEGYTPRGLKVRLAGGVSSPAQSPALRQPTAPPLAPPDRSTQRANSG